MVDAWQSFEYLPGSEYALVLQSFEDARVTESYENARNIPEYAHLHLNLPEYVLISLNSWNAWRLLPITLNPESTMES